MSALRGMSVALVVLALLAGGGFWLQRETTTALQSELALVRDEHRALGRLRAEHQRLMAEQPATAELERLRSDRTALMRLRSEIEQLKARVEQMVRAERSAAITTYVTSTALPPPPALALNMIVGAEGNVTMEGGPLDLGLLRQRCAGLARGNRVDFLLKMDGAAGGDAMKRSLNEIAGLMKELGLKMTVKFDRSSK